MTFNNSHTIDIPDEDAETLLNSSDFITWEEFEAEVNRPIPFYIDLYNLFRYRIPYKLECAIRDVKSRWQRSQHGYAKEDVWSMYIYIADLMSKMSIDLSQEIHGYPPSAESQEEWEAVLIRISTAFAKIGVAEERGNFLSDDEKKELDEAFDLLKAHFCYMWD